jgi:hypothetical protein
MKKVDLRSLINSPWLLVVVPFLVGGFWLVSNPWVITDNLDKPYALLAGPSLVGSLLAGWLVIKFFAAIERGCRLAGAAFLRARKEDGSAQFFWMVITVFLAVSVFASGSFFSLLERDAFPGLGYATALFIDLVAIQCMRARLNAGRLRDGRGQLLYLLGVLVCASASAFANVYTSLASFTDKAAGALPAWMPAIAPWFGVVFPVLIVLLSMTADYTVDQTSSKLDPDHYKAQESKRVKLLEIQRDLLRDRVGIEREIDELAAVLRGRKDRRVFFLVEWLFPRRQNVLEPHLEELAEQVRGLQQVKPLDAGVLISDITKRLDAVYGSRFEALARQNEDLSTELLLLITEVQGADIPTDNPADNEDATSVKAPSSEQLISDVQDVLIDYPIVERWLSAGQRSVTIEEIIEVTNHTRKMVMNRVNDRTLTRTRRAGFYRVDSVLRWLKTAPLPKGNHDTSGKLEAVKVGSNGHGETVVHQEELEPVTV